MAGRTISFVKGKGNINHNNREFSTKNVDIEKTKDNITYKKEPIEEAYQKCFGQAIEDYNAKQKRSDRKIDNYIEQVSHSKNGEKVFYENVVQIGDMYDTNINSKEAKASKKVLSEYAEKFQERNPNLYVFNMTLHMDEQTPHLHIDYIPVASGYKTGLPIRNSLTKAFENMGIESGNSRKDNSTIHWQNREREYLKELCEKNNIKTKELGIKRDNFTLDEYRVLTDTMKKELKEVPTESIEKKPTLFSDKKVVVDKEELESLEQRATIAKVYKKNVDKAVDQANKVQEELYTTKEQFHKATVDLVKRAEDYRKAYEQQVNLNKDYNSLVGRYNEVIKENDTLRGRITSLEGQIDVFKKSFEEKFQSIVEPLKKQVTELQGTVKGVYESFKNTVKAVGMLKYSKDEYKAELTPKQSKLIDAISDYSGYWMKKDGFPEMAEELEKEIGISKGIRKFTYNQIEYTKGKEGLGYYASKAEGGEFLGTKEDGKLLKDMLPNAKFKDSLDRGFSR